MKTFTIDVPSMYADHHVQEVRRLLTLLPGVEDVYASSSYLVVEITYDPEKIDESRFNSILEGAGYTSDMQVPVESGVSAYNQDGIEPFFRHTSTYETTRQNVSFTQRINYSGRPLWNCPGFGVINNNKMED